MSSTKWRALDRVEKQSGFVVDVCEDKDKGFMCFANVSGGKKSSISWLYLARTIFVSRSLPIQKKRT